MNQFESKTSTGFRILRPAGEELREANLPEQHVSKTAWRDHRISTVGTCVICYGPDASGKNVLEVIDTATGLSQFVVNPGPQIVLIEHRGRVDIMEQTAPAHPAAEIAGENP